MAEYTVTLKDADGYDVATDLVDGLGAAKARAKHFLTDDYARNIETTHATLGSHKVEVSLEGVCLWDAFLPRRAGGAV